MKTKLVNEWSVALDALPQDSMAKDRRTIFSEILNRDVELFIKKSSAHSPVLNKLNQVLESAVSDLMSIRWIELIDNLYFDREANGFWLIEDNMSYLDYFSGEDTLEFIESEINDALDDGINTWSLPNYSQLSKLRNISSAPFLTDGGRPSYSAKYLCKNDGNEVECWYLNNRQFHSTSANGFPIPFLGLASEDVNPRTLLIEFLQRGFTPVSLKSNEAFATLLNAFHLCSEALHKESLAATESIINEAINQKLTNMLLLEDTVRIDTLPYQKKILEDTELGHWSLWQDEIKLSEEHKFQLSKSFVARDPKSSINDGLVAIDFGTKSTVVVYQKGNVNIHPMRIGTGDLSTEVESYHYENPTIMEFINLESFTSAYNAKANKPYTRWKDLTISHTAQNSMKGIKSSNFNTFLDEIKQWAGDKNRKLKIVGQQGKIIDLPPFLELTDDDFNPIEIYAYYLGLYINNQNNGIFMDYILSFPVTYEMPIRDKIIESFEKGFKKSLPAELGEEAINELTVTKGASEPAAYALTALQQYGFEPEGDERVFYSVFDFGGGTTDFDFGIFSEPIDRKDKRRFDYVIEHFGAGGDKFLGGENLLELLAFEIFKKNKTKLLENGIQFEKHPEKDVFAGSEQLLSNSQEARMNTNQLCVALRPFWEEHEDFSFGNSGELDVVLTDINGIQHSAFGLDIDEEELNQILSNRIERGVENFFDALRLAFSNSRLALTDIDNVKIFLAGNSSLSSFVHTLFEKHIALQHQEMGISEGESCFELFAPLGADKNDVEKPTGKTGVAFGLIESREGGSVKVVDHNIANEDVRFKYYLGESRKKKFKPLIDREMKFNQWHDFIDAYYDTFEIFFTDQPSSSTGHMSIEDSSIKKKVVKLDVTDEEALVYIRVVSPTTIECVVANEDDIANEQYLNEIQRIEL